MWWAFEASVSFGESLVPLLRRKRRSTVSFSAQLAGNFYLKTYFNVMIFKTNVPLSFPCGSGLTLYPCDQVSNICFCAVVYILPNEFIRVRSSSGITTSPAYEELAMVSRRPRDLSR